jgi:hypothetical protein
MPEFPRALSALRINLSYPDWPCRHLSPGYALGGRLDGVIRIACFIGIGRHAKTNPRVTAGRIARRNEKAVTYDQCPAVRVRLCLPGAVTPKPGASRRANVC